MKTIMVMLLVCVMLCVSGCRDKEQASIAKRMIALAEARLEWEKEQSTIVEDYQSQMEAYKSESRYKTEQLLEWLKLVETAAEVNRKLQSKLDDYRDYKTKVKAYCEEQNTLIKWYQNKVKIYGAKLKAYETINQKYEGPTPRAYK